MQRVHRGGEPMVCIPQWTVCITKTLKGLLSLFEVKQKKGFVKSMIQHWKIFIWRKKKKE